MPPIPAAEPTFGKRKVRKCGVLIRGPSGTAKSTAVRGLAALLPQVEEVNALANMAQRVQVMRRREAFLADPAGFTARYQESQEQLRHAIQGAITLFPQVTRWL